MLMGEHYLSIDAKGRVTIPARFRSALGDKFVVTRGIGDFLTAYPPERWQLIEERLAAFSITNRTGMKLTSLLVGNARECEVDKMGRILLTQALRDKAGLDKEVVIVGMGDRVDIWDRDKWMDYNSPDNMTEEERREMDTMVL